MKKRLSKFLALICASALVACGGEPTASDETGPPADEAAPTPAPSQNQSQNQIVITNGVVLTMNEAFDVWDNGGVLVEGDKIVAIGADVTPANYPDATVIDAEGGIIMPGMINLHNHLSMVAFRGIAETGVRNFEDRLFRYFFPLEKNLLNRNLIFVSARHAAIEMALGGVTLTADMYYHEDEVARAVKEVGLRGVLGQSVIGFPVVDAAIPFGGLAYAENFLKEWADDPLITPAIAPHAPYTVSQDKLLESKALADKYGAPILIHVAEVANEAQMVDIAYPNTMRGRSIIEYLDEIGFLGTNVISAHTNYVSASDIELLKKNGVGIAHNPKANTKDMSGLSPAWDMYKAGLDIGLGTDGPMSSNQMDILSVMPFAARVSRIANGDISKFNPRELVEMATIGGARAIDMDDRIGSLEAGKLADIVVVETKSPNMQPSYNPYATLVFSAYPSNVVLTMVNGVVVAENGEIKSMDIDAHEAAWSEIIDRVAAFHATLN